MPIELLDLPSIDRMELPWFHIERVQDVTKLCELLMCYPAETATHKVVFHDTGSEVLICNRHAVGIVGLGEYINRRVELKPL
jgi:hypothetical protein